MVSEVIKDKGHPEKSVETFDTFSLYAERRLGQILSEVIKHEGRPEKSLKSLETFSLKDHCTRQNLEHRIWLENMGF